MWNASFINTIIFLNNITAPETSLPPEGNNREREELLLPMPVLNMKLEIIKDDPFYIHQVADYDITEFIPSKYNEHFKFFIKNS